jgi:hypothetical protein
VLFTSSDPDDADADAVFLFHPENPSEDRISGLLVVKSTRYAELAALDKNGLKRGVDDLVHGNWGTGELGPTAQHLTGSVVALYGLSHFREGFPVKLQPNADGPRIEVTVGDVELVVEEPLLSQLCQEPAIVRDLTIARALEHLDPALGRYYT